MSRTRTVVHPQIVIAATVLLLCGCASTPSAPSAGAQAEARWADYYDKTGEREPRRLLLEALELFDKEAATLRRAVDAGCGTGVEGRFLARMGIDVIAFDAEDEAIRRLREALNDAEAKHVKTEVAKFHEAYWGRNVDLVFAGFALPFSHPDDFPQAWRKMTASLAEGGRFAGHLFGNDDSWAERPEMTHHRREEVERLLAEHFEVEVLREIKEEGPTASGMIKHWHYYEIIARKR